MKNIKHIIIKGIFLTFFFLFINCDSKNEENEALKLIPSLIGKIHNDALDNILSQKNNFNYDTTISEFKTQIINENKLFLKKRINKIKFVISPKENLLDVSNLLSKNFAEGFSRNNQNFSMEESNIFEKIGFIQRSNVISLEDKEFLDNLFTAYKRNYEGELSTLELFTYAQELKSSYQSINSNILEKNVYTTLVIFEICVNSLEWFNNNIETISKNSNKGKLQRFWNIVAADGIGAIVGIGAAIVEHAITNGTTTSVNGDDVVYGAIEGAVMGSVGSVIRIGGWISNIIK